MKRPADVVAVLDSDISSVSDSMNGPNSANVLQTQIGCFALGLALHCRDLKLPSAAVILESDALFPFTLLHSDVHLSHLHKYSVRHVYVAHGPICPKHAAVY